MSHAGRPSKMSPDVIRWAGALIASGKPSHEVTAIIQEKLPDISERTARRIASTAREHLANPDKIFDQIASIRAQRQEEKVLPILTDIGQKPAIILAPPPKQQLEHLSPVDQCKELAAQLRHRRRQAVAEADKFPVTSDMGMAAHQVLTAVVKHELDVLKLLIEKGDAITDAESDTFVQQLLGGKNANSPVSPNPS